MAAPPVLLLHGFATSAARTWGDNGWLDLLADAEREVLAPDLPGHGQAAKSHDPEAYADLPGWLLTQLPDERVDAIGFSMGAMTLLRAAAQAPERFHRIVVAGVGRNVFEDDVEHGRAIREAIAGNADPENPEAMHFSDLAASPEVDRDALLAVLSGRGDRITPEALATLTLPVLVVLGDRDFAGPPDPLVAALPDAQLRTLRGVDHFATPKDFGFIDAALEFLGAVPV